MRIRLAFMAGLATIVVAGCGSSGGDTSTTALSKSEFLAQGNAICKKGNQEIQAASAKAFGNSQPSAGDVNAFVTKTVIPNIQGQIDGVKALGAPAGDEDQVQQIVDAAQSALDQAKDNPSLMTGQSAQGPFIKANKLAADYGLTECAK